MFWSKEVTPRFLDKDQKSKINLFAKWIQFDHETVWCILMLPLRQSVVFAAGWDLNECQSSSEVGLIKTCSWCCYSNTLKLSGFLWSMRWNAIKRFYVAPIKINSLTFFQTNPHGLKLLWHHILVMRGPPWEGVTSSCWIPLDLGIMHWRGWSEKKGKDGVQTESSQINLL